MHFRRTLCLLVMVILIKSWIADSQNHRAPSRKQYDARAGASKDPKERYACNKCADETMASNILKRLLARYDNRLRPNLGGAPVAVGVSLHIISIKGISEESLDYTITLYIHQTWKDSRLAYHEMDLNLTLNHVMLKKLWFPGCYIVNSRDSFVYPESQQNRMFWLQPDGTVQYGIKLTTTVPCDINLKNYPLDKQTCKLGVKSYAYSSEDVTLYWDGDDKAVQISENLIIPQFTFLGRKLGHKESSFYTGSYIQLVMTFWMQRKSTGFILHIYWPLILLTITSWITFWMSCKSSTSRVTLGLSSTLILNSLSTLVRESLPQVTCIKAIDIYMAVCFCLVILSLMEYAYINYVYYSRRDIRRQNRRLRRIQRIMARYRFEEQMKQKSAQKMRAIEGGDQLPGPCEERPAPPSPPPVIVHPRPNSDDSQNVFDDEDASPAGSMRQARRASPESCSPLSTVSRSAPLASSESLSSLSSVSTQSSRTTKESLNEVAPTSARASSDFLEGARALPLSSHLHAEAHGYPDTEDPDDTSSSGANLGQRPQERQDRSFPHSLDDILEDDPKDLADDIQPEHSACNIEEDPKDADGESLDLSRELLDPEQESSDLSREFLDPEKDSSSDEDSLPDNATFLEKILHPSYISTIDKCCRLVFPLIFLVFNIFYWLFHFV